MDGLREIWNVLNETRERLIKLETHHLHRAEVSDKMAADVTQLDAKIDTLTALVNQAKGGWFVAAKGSHLLWLIGGAGAVFAFEYAPKLIGH